MMLPLLLLGGPLSASALPAPSRLMVEFLPAGPSELLTTISAANKLKSDDTGHDANDCVNAPQQDCVAEGSYTCIAAAPSWGISGASGQGSMGYCHEEQSSPSGWQCCRLRLNQRPLQPAPERPKKSYPAPPAERPAKGTSSVIFFLTDDQDVELGSLQALNNTKALLAAGGTTLHNYFVTLPICCPSRISYLTGRYPHNTGAVATTPAGWCAEGIYWKGEGQKHSLPTWISGAGISTGIFGKEVNVNDDSFISPGWDRFFVLGGTSEGHYYNDWFNDQGTRFNASQTQYMTTLIQAQSLRWLTEQLTTRKRYFAYIAPHAPHVRATPQPHTEGYFWGEHSPRTPSWNKSMPDHHWLVRAQEPLTPKCIEASDELYRNRLRALLGVDELVGEVADLVASHGQLDRTYFLFTSDHGFHLGEMNMPYFKGQPYDTDLRVPFMVRGPGIAAGVTSEHIGLNIDVAPTIASLLGLEPPAAAKVDGRSMEPILFGTAPSDDAGAWRTDFVFEFFAGGRPGGRAPRGPYCSHMIMAPNNTYHGVRTLDGHKYVDFSPYEDIEEAFDLNADPFEMTNLARAASPPPWIAELRARLAVLRNCSQDVCRSPAPRGAGRE